MNSQSQLYQPVPGVINKDCIQAECLYSSQIQHPNCEGTEAVRLPPHHLSSHGPSARMNTHEQLLSPPEIECLLLPLLTRWSSFRTGIEA